MMTSARPSSWMISSARRSASVRPTGSWLQRSEKESMQSSTGCSQEALSTWARLSLTAISAASWRTRWHWMLETAHGCEYYLKKAEGSRFLKRVVEGTDSLEGRL